MFKKLAAVSAALVCSLGAMPEAKASWDYCMNAGPTNICAQYRTNNDVVQMQGPAGYVRIGIKCEDLGSQYRWEYKVFEASTGNAYTKQMMEEFASGYCEGRLGL